MPILIAEDAEDQARILTAVLKSLKKEVVRVASGAEAYEYIKKNPGIELLITDIVMPGMSGFELLQRLKSEGLMPPTIVVTSQIMEEEMIRGLDLGVIDYMTKPFSPGVVLSKVRNSLVRKAA